MDFYAFVEQYYLIFMVWVQCYLIFFGLCVLYFAFKTRLHPEKVSTSRLFKNEILIGIMFFVAAGFYPFLFTDLAPASVRSQLYFHLWDSLTVNLVIWGILLPLWKKKDKQSGFAMNESEWHAQIHLIFKERAENRNSKNNFVRKKVHFIYIMIILGLYYLGVILENFGSLPAGWTGQIVSVWLQVAVIINYLWIMIIFDLVRLLKFNSLMSKFLMDSASTSLKRDELYSFTSAHVLLLALIPFVPASPSPQVLMAVWAITALSDAMASIIGMKFGKQRPTPRNDHKTLEGYIAGFMSTFLIILFTHLICPFPNITWMGVTILAFLTAAGFFLVDFFVREISDNLMNPLICGLVLVIMYPLVII